MYTKYAIPLRQCCTILLMRAVSDRRLIKPFTAKAAAFSAFFNSPGLTVPRRATVDLFRTSIAVTRFFPFTFFCFTF